MGLRSSQSVSGTKQTSAVVSMSQLLTYSYAAGFTPAMAAKTVKHWFAIYLLFRRDGQSICNLVFRLRLL